MHVGSIGRELIAKSNPEGSEILYPRLENSSYRRNSQVPHSLSSAISPQCLVLVVLVQLPTVHTRPYQNLELPILLLSSPSSAMSYQTKILRTANAPLTPPSEIEQQIAQALLDLENNVPDLKSELRQLQISAAKEVDVKGGKKAVVVFVPVPMVKAFHTIQQR